MKKITVHKNEMVQNIIESITLQGSLQRANVYNDNISESDRKNFRRTLVRELKKSLDIAFTKENYTDLDHYNSIEKYANKITKVHSNLLKENKLRIGIAQKLVNLYWKLSWLFIENINPPIHCPFDSIIIGKLDKSAKGYTWTKIDDMNDYKTLVKAAKNASSLANCSIAEWELKIYLEELKK